MNSKRKPIPRFSSIDEEREFWATHDSAEYLDWSKAERNPTLPLENSAGLHGVGHIAGQDEASSLGSSRTLQPKMAECGQQPGQYKDTYHTRDSSGCC